jgi:hypothetical protein
MKPAKTKGTKKVIRSNFRQKTILLFMVAGVVLLASTAIGYPPMQVPATFNFDAVKKRIDEMMKEHEGQ